MKLNDIGIPDSTAARAAYEVSSTYQSPAMHNHCVRSYLWGAAYGDLNGVRYDAELLYVASMLHDLGLVPSFDSHTVAFEDAGGHVGWVFAAGAGWPVDRRTRVAEVIVRHMWPEVDPAMDPEGHLLELATGLDTSGRQPEAWPDGLRGEVLARHPRLDFGVEVVACFQDQAARKPDTLAARMVRNGMADRIAANPLDRPA